MPVERQAESIVADPPYNNRREEDIHFSEKGAFIKTDMIVMMNLFQTVLEPAGPGPMFCSNVQFAQWIA